MKISIFRPLARPACWSMEICADQAMESLKRRIGKDDTIQEYRPPYRANGNLSFHYAKYLRYQFRAPRHQADVNHITDHSYGHLVFSLDPRKTVVTFHDAVLLKLMDGSIRAESYPRMRMIAQRFSLSGAGRARRVIAVSQASKDAFLRYAGRFDPDRVAVVYNGIDPGFRPIEKPRLDDVYDRYKLDRRVDYVMHVGHNEFYKNVEGVLRVLKKLDGACHLLKIGSDFTPTQTGMIADWGLKQRIHLVPNAPRRDIPYLMNAARVLLFPSLDEGFGLPVAEAMASGVPVVCSDIAALREIASDAALFYPSKNAAGMAEGIQRILSDHALGLQLVRRGLERSSHFTWDKCARSIYRIYREIYEDSAS